MPESFKEDAPVSVAYNYLTVQQTLLYLVPEFSSLGRMRFPWWQRHEAATVKMAYSLDRRVFSEHPHNIMQTLLQLCQQVAFLGHFLSAIPCLLIVSTMFSKNSFRFSKECVPISEQYFHNRMEIGHIANTVLDVFNEHIDDRVLSNRFPKRF
jgi:hypothetical protein